MDNQPLNRTVKDGNAIYDQPRPKTDNPNLIARKPPAKTIVPAGGSIDLAMNQQDEQPTRYTGMLKGPSDDDDQ